MVIQCDLGVPVPGLHFEGYVKNITEYKLTETRNNSLAASNSLQALDTLRKTVKLLLQVSSARDVVRHVGHHVLYFLDLLINLIIGFIQN